jgi:hypothetical protein
MDLQATTKLRAVYRRRRDWRGDQSSLTLRLPIRSGILSIQCAPSLETWNDQPLANTAAPSQLSLWRARMIDSSDVLCFVRGNPADGACLTKSSVGSSATSPSRPKHQHQHPHRHHSASKETPQCGHVTRDQIIDTVGASSNKRQGRSMESVNLRQPDYTVWIEICKTLTGVSIFRVQCRTCHGDFNLAEIRGKLVAE